MSKFGKLKSLPLVFGGTILLSGCMGQLIIGSDVNPYLGRRWQDYDYAHPDASCGVPYEDKYRQRYVRCTTGQYGVTFKIDDGDRIKSYSGSLSD